MVTETGDDQQIDYLTKLAQQQDEQIRLLVNLLLAVLGDKPDARNRAENVIFVETMLYEYIKVKGEEARAIVVQLGKEREEMLRRKTKINELKRMVISMELDTLEVRYDE